MVHRSTIGLALLVGLLLAFAPCALAQTAAAGNAVAAAPTPAGPATYIVPAGTRIVRLLPPLNLKPQEAGEGISKIGEVVKSLA